MEKLSLILWRERELLETLQYRLEVEQLVMASGRTAWLMRAARDVESVLEDIRLTEVMRATVADELAEQLGLAPNPSLSSLIEKLPEPWSSLFAEHREAFVATTTEISRLAEANRLLVSAGFLSAREALLNIGGTAATYTPDGTTTQEPTRAALIDWSL